MISAEAIAEILGEKKGQLIIPVYIQPRASKTEITGIINNRLKIRICSPPVDNKANKECVRFLAKTLKVAKTDINITSGLSSRNKLVAVNGFSKSCAIQLLAHMVS